MGLTLDFFYLLACLALSPWLLARFAMRRGRQDLPARFGGRLGGPLEGSIWLHGSSAGEISLLKPLVTLLERDFPGTPLVISAFTMTGLAAARRLYAAHRVVAFPFDLSFVVKRCLKHFDPLLVIVVESELWPNFISAAHRRGIPLAVVNGKMSERSRRRYARTWLIPRALAKLDLIAAQTVEHAERFRSLGVPPERIRVTGNMKYDLARASADPAAAAALRRELGYGPQDTVIIGGSVHAGEDEAMLQAYRAALAADSRAALILVPRYPDDVPSVAEHVRSAGHRAVVKSAVDSRREAAPGRTGVLIVDTVGELGRLYAAADLAFVGGSLYFRGANKGGHNLMEPAILGVPVLFGPYNFSFKETVDDLLAARAGCLVRDSGELAATVGELVADAARRRELGERSQHVVLAGQGATARNYALLVDLFGAQRRRLQAQHFDRKMPRAASGSDSPL
jgi:3-deoxy-D-manno-octulosonic-acid transferase